MVPTGTVPIAGKEIALKLSHHTQRTSVAARKLGFLVLLFFLPASTLSAEDAATLSTDTYKRIKTRVDAIRLIDTHEHTVKEESYLKATADFLADMTHYVEADLRSAGYPHDPAIDKGPRVQNRSIPFAERWALFETYWPEMRFTGYGRALTWLVKDLYGMDLDRLRPGFGEELNERIAADRRPGHYRRILKEKARIDLIIIDSGLDVDREFFAPVMRCDDFIQIRSRQQIERLAERTKQNIHSLADLENALQIYFENGLQKKIVGVKSGLAYSRRISYPRPPREKAQEAFQNVMRRGVVPEETSLPLQNHMMNQLADLAERHQLPFQIHTGLQTGNGNWITNSKPTELVDLIMAHPKLMFVIFHAGYPYGSELATMAKNFANVTIDMCWTHIISPKVARDYLAEYIETVPANKITGFGGDYRFVEGTYMHAEMARQNIAWVLAEKVCSGYLNEDQAVELAEKLLRRNAIAIYRLGL